MSIEMWNSGDESITIIQTLNEPKIQGVNDSIIHIRPIGNKIVYTKTWSLIVMDTTGNILFDFGINNGVRNIIFMMDNQQVIVYTCSDIMIFDICAAKYINHCVIYDKSMNYIDKNSEIDMASVSQNGNQLACVTKEIKINIFGVRNISEWHFVGNINSESRVYCLCYSPDNRIIISGHWGLP
jgi:WD40 repeat protein